MVIVLLYLIILALRYYPALNYCINLYFIGFKNFLFLDAELDQLARRRMFGMLEQFVYGKLKAVNASQFPFKVKSVAAYYRN